MRTYAITVTPEVANTRQREGGSRRVALTVTFTAAPQIWIGDLPPALAGDTGLRIRELGGREALQALEGPIHTHGAKLTQLVSPVGADTPSPGAPAQRAGAPAALLTEILKKLDRVLLLVDDGESTPPAVAPSPAAGAAALDGLDRAALDELHHQLLGRRPHPNAGDDTVRAAIQKAQVSLPEGS